MSRHIKSSNSGAQKGTLQDVMAGVDANSTLSATRRRDLKSAVNCFANLTGSTPSAIALDLSAIRKVLDLMVPIQANVSQPTHP